jgi:hypothetical protein
MEIPKITQENMKTEKLKTGEEMTGSLKESAW